MSLFISYLVDVALGVGGVGDESPCAEEGAEEGEADDVRAAALLGGAAVEVRLVGVPHAVVGLIVVAAAPLAPAARAGAAALCVVKQFIRYFCAPLKSLKIVD